MKKRLKGAKAHPIMDFRFPEINPFMNVVAHKFYQISLKNKAGGNYYKYNNIVHEIDPGVPVSRCFEIVLHSG